MKVESGQPVLDRYDELVASSPQGSIFASSWWLDAVAEGRWRPHALEAQGAVVAAWPTVVRRTRFGDVHAGAPMTPFLGPLFRRQASELRRHGEQVKWLEQLVDTMHGVAHIEARCNPAFDYWAPLAWHGFRQTTNYTWRLSKLDDLTQLFSSVRENVRREIRKARKRGISIEDGSLDAFQSVHLATVEHQEIRSAEANRDALRRIDLAAAARGVRRILLARDADGRVHAGGYFVRDDRWVYYLAGASDPALRTSGASSLVLWHGIEHAGEHGLGFDFEGSMLRGVERFFRAFGGEPIPYSIVRNTPSSALRVALPVKRLLRSLR
jgi:GNAT acetyltransferase-like protein